MSVRYWFCVFTLAHLLKPPVFVHRAQHKMEEAFKAIVDLAARQQVQIRSPVFDSGSTDFDSVVTYILK